MRHGRKNTAALGLAAALALGWTATGLADGGPVCDRTAAEVGHAGASEACSRAWLDRHLRLNDLQAIGTHNSYKRKVPAPVLALVRSRSPGTADELDYAHRRLSEQLDAGMRQLELDIYADPAGGRFAAPLGWQAEGLRPDAAQRAALAEPGFKVFHIPDVDVASHCVTLIDCLGIVRRWSLAHPDHAPLLILLNAKTDASPVPGGVDALPFTPETFQSLDRTIRQVFPPSGLITPDTVQGRHRTLREAVLRGGWPRLGDARGKVLFALDEGPDKVAAYLGGCWSLRGRVLFVNADERSPLAAYLTLNDPTREQARIRAAVRAGFLVRTRADAGTSEARSGATARREAALASGAQFISTDYPWPDPRFASGYRVLLPGAVAARCNPLRAARRCDGQALERAAPAGEAYLTAEGTPDGLRVLAPPPAAGGPRARADRALFAATRRLAGSPRWAIARADVESGAFGHFACALGMALSPAVAPALARLLDRAGTAGVVDPVKTFYRVRRPYLGTRAPLCQARTRHLASNGDYPSGHAAGGWLEALILAELVPERASAILARGRGFGESRVVCGSHSASAVEAGWLAGDAANAALHADAGFRQDLEAARAEMVALRHSAPAPPAAACRREAQALATPIIR